MSLIEALKKEKERGPRVGDTLIAETKLLLQDNAWEERDMIVSIGLSHTNKVFEEELESNILLKQNELEYDVVYTKAHIQSLCRKYRLRLLSPYSYKGATPPSLGRDVINFQNKYNIPKMHSSNVVMLAPAELFNTPSISPLKALAKGINNFVQSQKDPALLYITPERFYVPIKSWGSDFTILRRIKGWLFYRAMNLALACACIPFAIIMLCAFKSYPVTAAVWGVIAGALVHFLVWRCGVTVDLDDKEWHDSDDGFTISNWEH